MKTTTFFWPESHGCLGCIHAICGEHSSITCEINSETPDCEDREYDVTCDEDIDLLEAELEDPRNHKHPELIEKIQARIDQLR